MQIVCLASNLIFRIIYIIWLRIYIHLDILNGIYGSCYIYAGHDMI